MLGIGPREIAAAVRTLSRGELARYHTSGESETAKFEAELADAMGTTHALAVNSGTSALICALVGASIGPGDEVLVPAYTWVSTAAAVLAVGAVPVLVDVDESLTIDPAEIEAKATDATRAVIPVHMINLACDMDAIMAIASAHDLVVIEDACQAIGVRHRGRPVGSIGDVGVFSFNQHKNLKSGEGGALITNDGDIYGRAGVYHDVGSYGRSERFQLDEPTFPGMNFRMPELSAAILRPQLRRLDRQIEIRQARRTMVVDHLASLSLPGLRIASHHNDDEVVGLGIVFDDQRDATRFGATKGAKKLADTGRHVYTNWESVMSKHPQHRSLDPYRWSDRQIEFDDTMCSTTIDLLNRACTVEMAIELPAPAFRLLTKRLG